MQDTLQSQDPSSETKRMMERIENLEKKVARLQERLQHDHEDLEHLREVAMHDHEELEELKGTGHVRPASTYAGRPMVGL